MTKQKIKQVIVALRKIIPQKERVQADERISDEVKRLSVWTEAHVVCLYMSLPDEVNTKFLIADLFNHNKSIVLPRIEKDKLILRKISSIKDLVPGSFGILEPKKSCRIMSSESVDLFIVPGIVFDKNGYRLGWGKGYYDKLLAAVTVPKIGLAYSIQLIAEVPHTSYDVPMDMVVTEGRTYENKAS